MLENKEVQKMLAEIANVYPTVRGLMRADTIDIDKSGKDEVVGKLWAEKLRDLDPYFLRQVCGDFADLKLELPNPADRLPFAIRSEVKRRAEELAEKGRERLKSDSVDARHWTTEKVLQHFRKQQCATAPQTNNPNELILQMRDAI